MTSVENNVSEPPNLKSFRGDTARPPNRARLSALAIMPPLPHSVTKDLDFLEFFTTINFSATHFRSFQQTELCIYLFTFMHFQQQFH